MKNPNDTEELHYLIAGLSCGGCVSQCEKLLSTIDGVEKSYIRFESNECHISYDPLVVSSLTIEEQALKFGYELSPFTSFEQTESLEEHERYLLSRLGVAGIAMMQVVMISVALHFHSPVRRDSSSTTPARIGGLKLTQPPRGKRPVRTW